MIWNRPLIATIGHLRSYGLARALMVALVVVHQAIPAQAGERDACLEPRQDVHQVLSACADFINSSPAAEDIVAARYNRGIAYLVLGIPYLALSEFDKAIAVDPSHDAPWAGRAEANMRMGAFKIAQADLAKALIINPRRPESYDLQALIADEVGDTSTLQKAGDEEIRLNPNAAEGYARRGQAYADRGDIDKAGADFQRAAALSPGWASAWARLGTFFAMKREPAQALAAFGKALAIDPNSIEAHVNRGKLLEERGEIEKSALDYQAALSRSSDSARSRRFQKEAISRLVAVTKNVPRAQASSGTGAPLQTVKPDTR